MWVPGIATLLCVPFQFLAYLSPDLAVALPSFVGLMFMAAVFFGPSFAMTQALATLRMRRWRRRCCCSSRRSSATVSVRRSPACISDWLVPSFQRDSLRYALVIIGVVNFWAAVHYMLGRAGRCGSDLELTEKLASAASSERHDSGRCSR